MKLSFEPLRYLPSRNTFTLSRAVERSRSAEEVLSICRTDIVPMHRVQYRGADLLQSSKPPATYLGK
jgi:hypothetical protein